MLTLLWPLLVGALLVVAALPARAEVVAEELEVTAQLADDGRLDVTLTLRGDDLGSDVQLRLDQRVPLGDLRTLVHSVDQVRATVGGQSVQPRVTHGGDAVTIAVDPSVVAGGDVVIGYRVTGTTSRPAGGADHIEFSWPLVQGLNMGVTSVVGSLTLPATPPDVDCKAGDPSAPHSCALWNLDRHTPRTVTFQDGPLGAGGVVAITLMQPTSVRPTAQVETRWTLDHAFSLTTGSALASLAVLALGGVGLWQWHRRLGRDEVLDADPMVIAEFHPVGDGVSEFRVTSDVRPGQVGTVANERVDPIDVTATLLDLAVRGFLRIEQFDVDGAIDWRFERLDADPQPLHPYERLLLDAVAPEDEPPVAVSRIQDRVGPLVPQLQDSLYADVVAQGWFSKHPDAARIDSRNIGAGILLVGLIATGLLAWLTSWGLVGIAVVAVGVASLFIAGEMPRRSATGVRLLAGLHGLRAILAQQRFDTLPKGHELAEISKVLPFAVVLGGRERWLDAMVAADPDDDPDPEALPWYHAPQDWHLRQLPASIDALITSIQGRLFGR